MVGHAVAVRPSGRQIDLTLRVDPGPRVSLEFEGDALPAEIRETLVPVAREGSVDEDLLEDSSRRLVDYLRQLGFRRVLATYTRVTDDQELRIVYHVERGPRVRIGSIEIEGDAALPRAVLEDRLGEDRRTSAEVVDPLSHI